MISNIVHASEVEDYALATLRSSSGTLVHVEVGYTMPTWPANESDSEMKVAGSNAMLSAVSDGLQILAPGRNEHIGNSCDRGLLLSELRPGLPGAG